MRVNTIRFMAALAAAAALAASAGCGGGGGGGGGSVGNNGGGGNPGTALHTMAVGDTWSYNITGTATASGKTSSTVTGTITRTIVSASKDGATMAIQETSTYNFTGGGLDGATGGGTTTTYFIQDGNGNVYETGQDSAPDVGNASSEVVSSPSAASDTIIPGAWAANSTTTANITYTDSSNLTQNFAIRNNGTVTTSAGNFPVWNVSVSVNGGSASPQTWDPTVGSYVTNTLVQTANLNGAEWTITTTAKLSSYHLAA